MYPDLTARLRQDIKKLNRNELYLIRDYSLADGSFLLYHFITLYLRGAENGKVYTLALSHSVSHYKVVLAKLGVQSQRQMEQNRCRILDFSYFLSLSDDSIKNEAPWFRFGIGNRSSFADKDSGEAEEAVKLLYLRVKSEIEDLTSQNTPSTNSDSKPPLLIVIDCVSVLLDLRVPLKNVVQFLHYLGSFGRLYDASFAILTKTDDAFRPSNCDEASISDYDRLATYLFSWGSISVDKALVFDVKPLATGWSQDVHGEVTIREIKAIDDEETTKTAQDSETRLLFRLGDRNVTFMAPGLVPRIGV